MKLRRGGPHLGLGWQKDGQGQGGGANLSGGSAPDVLVLPLAMCHGIAGSRLEKGGSARQRDSDMTVPTWSTGVWQGSQGPGWGASLSGGSAPDGLVLPHVGDVNQETGSTK
jgi:hypothetical protein